ncbi:MAG: 50S ribosomal protein L23 [Spirochaetales bacterium]|nr:50S ribosomal protein L23 [Spirochaetales bacterium]
MEPEKIIIEPVLTEKTNLQRETGETRKYTFKVHSKANKSQVMKAVKDLFSVHPVSCNVAIVKRKPRMSRSKSGMRVGYKAPWKKAIVTLRKGERIEAFEG